VVGAFDFGKIFVRNYRPDLRLRVMAESYRIARRPTSVLPATFILPMLIYAAHSLSLRDIFQGRFRIFGETPDVKAWPLDAAVMDRISILDQYLAFIRARDSEWGLFFNMWNFPARGADEYRRYWEDAPHALRQSADILPFLLRKEVARGRPNLARLVGRGSTRLYLGARRIGEKIGLRRRVRQSAAGLKQRARLPQRPAEPTRRL
jgi:hypothetical protein